MATMGHEDGLPERLETEDEEAFPTLVATGYRVTSPKDTSYNCIAHAADDQSQKWDCTALPKPGYYWPPNAKPGEDIDSLRSAFEAIGYRTCTSYEVEEGYEKVALYVDNDGFWSHAAKQKDSGEWSSKLGGIEDISHKSVHCFGDSIYGNAVYVMKRKKM